MICSFRLACVDKLDPDEVARCVAAMAVIAYVIADLPQGLPRS